MPTFHCPCCEEPRSQTNFASHLATHEKDITQYIVQKHDAYVAVKKGEREPIYCCFGCNKTFSTTSAASQHYKKGEDCRRKNKAFLFSIDAIADGAGVNVKLQKEVVRLRLENENLREDLMADKRLSREAGLEKRIKQAEDYILMIREWLPRWIMERITPEESQKLSNFWALEHNPARGSSQYKPPSDVVKDLKQQLQNDEFLQMMSIPTFESYCQACDLGPAMTTIALIPGQAFWNIHYVPPKWKFTVRNEVEIPKKNESPSPSDSDVTSNTTENDYYSEHD